MSLLPKPSIASGYSPPGLIASAFAAEPTNAQLLWDRARNLRQAGRLEEARKLLRQLADGSWQPRFQSLQRQARWQLDNP